jgi:hypothetical protein
MKHPMLKKPELLKRNLLLGLGAAALVAPATMALAQTIQPTSGGGSSTLTANSTATSGFTANQYLYSDGSKLQAGTSNGTGSLVGTTSPTLVTPNIGVATGTSLALSGVISTGVGGYSAPAVTIGEAGTGIFLAATTRLQFVLGYNIVGDWNFNSGAPVFKLTGNGVDGGANSSFILGDNLHGTFELLFWTDATNNIAKLQTFNGGSDYDHVLSFQSLGGTVKLPVKVDLSSLPTADPHVVGHAWSNLGIVTVSAG